MTQEEQQKHRLTELQVRGPENENPDDWAEWIVQQVHAVIECGLPEAYNDDIYSFLLDLGMDMPWTEALAIQVGQAIVAHKDFLNLRIKFQKRFNTGFWEVDPDNPTLLHINIQDTQGQEGQGLLEYAIILLLAGVVVAITVSALSLVAPELGNAIPSALGL